MVLKLPQEFPNEGVQQILKKVFGSQTKLLSFEIYVGSKLVHASS